MEGVDGNEEESTNSKKEKKEENYNNNKNNTKKKGLSKGWDLFYLTPQSFKDFAGLCLNVKWTETNANTNANIHNPTTKQIKSLLMEIALNQPWKAHLEKTTGESNPFKQEVVEILLWCARTLVKACFELVNVNPFNNEITSTEGLVDLLIESVKIYISDKKMLSSLVEQGIPYVLGHIYCFTEWRLSKQVLFKLNLLMVNLIKKLRKRHKDEKPWSEKIDKNLKGLLKSLSFEKVEDINQQVIEEHNEFLGIVKDILSFDLSVN